VRELTSKNLGGKIVPLLSAKRTLRGNPSIRHRANRRRNVLAALLAMDGEVAATGFGEIEHEEECRRRKNESANVDFSRPEPVENRLTRKLYLSLLFSIVYGEEG
jgi:hypothetical protein